MTRLLIGFMLTAYMLLLGGYSHSCCQAARFSPGKYFQNLTADDMPADTHCEEDQFTPSTPPDAREGFEKTKAVEIQEDEDAQNFRKQQLFCKILITAIFTDVNRLPSISPQLPLPFCQHFSYASADKFIVQRVIRI
ncbi:hypothetical protein [Chitinophaga rhizosphaerae]|uniref:hypothetical protein n=1 Tax=Chitinophaga rhizosphaerae TaxID=1864947 RepID=UPI000F8099E6|nr:hypothetical protein [Chitinophaga rhizosphaerae]